MKKILLIFESPSKIKTLSSYLSKDYIFAASFGHIFDLPKKKYGIDFENKFEPEFEVNLKSKKNLKEIIEKAKISDEILLATDPDREGEAIAFHLDKILKKYSKNIFRIKLREITEKELNKALNSKLKIDLSLVEAQFARRVLDRIFGFELSPELWKSIGNNKLSAGRVQSIALKWIVEREEEIKNFKSEDYFTLNLFIRSNDNKELKFNLDKEIKIQNKEKLTELIEKIINQKIEIKFEDNKFTLDIKNSKQTLLISDIIEKKINQSPPPPYITSSIQKDASNILKFNSEKTMKIAQKLYEGINISNGKRTGLITYMRTDSFRINDEISNEANKYIEKNFGEEFLSKRKNYNKENSSDAHESIHPTNLDYTPEKIKDFLKADEYNLYKLIYKRFIESQMSDYIFIKEDISGILNGLKFNFTQKKIIHKGYKILSNEKEENYSQIKLNEKLKIEKILSEQKKTEPPSRFTEASLIDKLDKTGIGRPSTYSSILKTLYLRKYILEEKKSLIPIGFSFEVIKFLKGKFQILIEDEFTKKMEDSLDEISEGKLIRFDFINEFYEKLKELKKTKYTINKTTIKKLENLEICPKCSHKLNEKKSKKGSFYLICSDFPTCDYMKYK